MSHKGPSRRDLLANKAALGNIIYIYGIYTRIKDIAAMPEAISGIQTQASAESNVTDYM
jgi:hypothetical protein